MAKLVVNQEIRAPWLAKRQGVFGLIVCENIFCGYLYDGDLAFVIVKGIYGFKFPKRCLEISSRDSTSLLLLFFFS